MSNALALGDANVGLYQTQQANAAGDVFGHRIGDYYPGLPIYPWGYPPVYPLTVNTITITGTGTAHRVCACPNCDGSCCDCADCKVKRLEARVAELEKNR